MKRWTLYLTIVVSSLQLWATEMTWKDSIKLAIQNNLELQIAESNVTAAEAQVIGSKSGFYPQLSASISDNQFSSNQSVSNSYLAQLNLSQNIFSGFSDLNKLNLAESNLVIARANLQIVKAKLSYDLKNAYESLYYAEAFAQLTADIEHRRESNLRNVELRFDGGRENKGSVLLSKAYFLQSQYEDLQAHRQLILAEELLRRILGVSPKTDIKLKYSLMLTSTVLKEPDYSALVLDTPDYKSAVAQAVSARIEVDTAQAGFYPSLDFNGSYGKIDSQFFPASEKWNLGLTLTLPLFNGGRDYAATKSAAAKSISATKAKNSLIKQIIEKLHSTYLDYAESFEKDKVDESFKKAAEVRAEIARNKYNNGLMSFEDWDLVENDLINRQKTFLFSKKNRTISEAAWEQAQGTGVIP